MEKRGRITSKEDILSFLTNPKNAIFTLQKKVDDMHRTFMINKSKDSDLVFVKLLIGADNSRWDNYLYLGLLLFKPHLKFKLRNSRALVVIQRELAYRFICLIL